MKTFELFALCALMTGCEDPQQFLSLVSSLKNERAVVEACVRDVKRSQQPTDSAYQSARAQYNVAFARHEGYVAAVRLAILLQAENANLAPILKTAQDAANAFISLSVQATNNSGNATRAVNVQSFPTDPMNVVNYVLSRRQQNLPALADAFADEARWRDWDSIR